MTACCECVWMHAPASRRSNAAQNNGVQADSFSGCVGLRRKVRVQAVAAVGGSGCGYGRTKMCSGRIRSFCTPEGAMKALSLRVGSQNEGLCIGERKWEKKEEDTVPLPNRDAPTGSCDPT